MVSFELVCKACDYRTICGAEDCQLKLRLIGLLRRDKNPDEAFVAALFRESTARMTCPMCKSVGLHAEDYDGRADREEDWQDAVLCEICRKPIPEERLEAIRNTKYCVGCQQKDEAGLLEEEPDFCPKCGSLVTLRVSRGSGITRYKRFCTGSPACRL